MVGCISLDVELYPATGSRRLPIANLLGQDTYTSMDFIRYLMSPTTMGVHTTGAKEKILLLLPRFQMQYGRLITNLQPEPLLDPQHNDTSPIFYAHVRDGVLTIREYTLPLHTKQPNGRG